MVNSDQIAQSKAIQQRTGKTFHVATRLLPSRIREATYVLYAFFRLADEIVDDADGTSPAEQRAELEQMRAAALGEAETDDPVLTAFAELREAHGIAETDINVFIDAMVTDISKDTYATYDELEAYMDGSAAAVGRMMTAVMEPDDPDKALPHATALGEAFQLTNFLRDVREDVVERDRVYLPKTTLSRHDVTYEEITAFEMSPRVAAVVQDELHRAEKLYEKGVAGIKYLPEDCQLAVLLSAVLYVDHHRLVRDRNYDVLAATPQLSLPRKLLLLCKTRLYWSLNGDPEAVFETVSAIRTADPRSHGPDHVERLPTR
ncbi:phytoene/squalene synthase family protein [Haloferacaceae archaeon DSL9]